MSVRGEYFREVEDRFNTGAASSQGIAVDGDKIYITDSSHIFVYDKTGTLIDSRDISSDGTLDKIGSLTIVDDCLVSTATNFPATPRESYAMRFNKDTLAFVDETYLGSDLGASGIGYRDCKYWFANNLGPEMRRYSADFQTIEKTYTLDTTFDGPNGWQSVTWIGDSVYLNVHGDTKPNGVIQYHYDEDNDRFIYVGELGRPANASQDMEWVDDEQKMYFCVRNFGSLADQVAVTRFEAASVEDLAVNHGYSNQTQSVTSGIYVTNPAVKARIYARKGDLIKVESQGIYRTTNTNTTVRVHASLSPGSPTNPTRVFQAPTMRSNVANAEGQSQHVVALFRAEEDGVAEWMMHWLVTNGGTGYGVNQGILVQVVGRDVIYDLNTE